MKFIASVLQGLFLVAVLGTVFAGLIGMGM